MSKYSLLKEKIDALENKKSSLIKILQEAQEIFGYLSEDTIRKISEFSKIPPTEILGVATFYTQFKLQPVGRHIIRVCEGTACHVNGANKIKNIVLDMLKVKEKEVSKDGYYSVESVACVGCCSLAPVIMIGEETFGNLSTKEVLKVIKTYKANNK